MFVQIIQMCLFEVILHYMYAGVSAGMFLDYSFGHTFVYQRTIHFYFCIQLRGGIQQFTDYTPKF